MWLRASKNVSLAENLYLTNCVTAGPSWSACAPCPGIPLSDSSVVPHLQIKQPCILEMAASTKVAGKRLVALVVFVMFAMQMFCLHMSRARGGELRPGL